MAHDGNWTQRLTDAANLHTQSLPGIPIVELAGDCRLLIECHRGVTEYSPQRICVAVSYGCICINGESLKLALMSRERLIIRGRVAQINLIKKGE